jgi:seryl-tRNA(Sec) selenium transferase
VGKEEIIGLMTALRQYGERDLDAELAGWKTDVETIVSSVAGIAGVAARVRFPQPSGRTVPHAVVSVNQAEAGLHANDVINALQDGDPSIVVFEHSGDEGTIVFMPEALKAGEAQVIANRLKEIFKGRA